MLLGKPRVVNPEPHFPSGLDKHQTRLCCGTLWTNKDNDSDATRGCRHLRDMLSYSLDYYLLAILAQ